MTDEPVPPPFDPPAERTAEPFPQAADPAVAPPAAAAPVASESAPRPSPGATAAPPGAPAAPTTLPSPALQPPFPSALPDDSASARSGPPHISEAPRESPVAEAPSPAPPRRRDDRPRAPRGPRPDLIEAAEPVFRESRGYRMRLEPADLTRLRELPGSKGKTDRELGETFFDGQSDRFTASLAEDVPSPADVRVVVDPYSRQAFLAVEKKIRSILSF